LGKAVQGGEVMIRRKDGQFFVVKPKSKSGSPLDVEGIDLGVTSADIVAYIRES
jgi:antitoxin Phd